MDALDFVDAMERRREELVKALDTAHDALEAVNRLVARASDPLLDILIDKMSAAVQDAVFNTRDPNHLTSPAVQKLLAGKWIHVTCPACKKQVQVKLVAE